MIKKITLLLIISSIAFFTGCGIDLNGDTLKNTLNGLLTSDTGKWNQGKWDQSKWGD